MKFLIYFSLFFLISCGGDDKTTPTLIGNNYRIDTLSNFQMLNEKNVSLEAVRNDIDENFAVFNEIPALASTHAGTVESMMKFHMHLSSGGQTQELDCQLKSVIQLDDTIEFLEPDWFTVKSESIVTESQLVSGLPENCETFVAQVGEKTEIEENFVSYSKGIDHLISMIMTENKKAGGKINSFSMRSVESAVGINEIYKGIYLGKTVFRILYNIIGELESESGSGSYKSNCQVIINPNFPAHFSMLKAECVGSSTIKLTTEEGTFESNDLYKNIYTKE